MSLLPAIDSPTYLIKLPVSKLDIKFRPYVVKEQKILMMAVESKENASLIEAISQIVQNCVLSTVDTKKLSITDIEYIFYNLRARSQSETVDLVYKCQNLVNGEFCDNRMYHKLNLLTDLDVTDIPETTIKLTDKIGVKLNFQTFDVENFKYNGEIPTPEDEFTLVARNIDFIYDEDSSYNTKDIPLKDIVDWLGKLTIEQYSKIRDFFKNEPRIHKNVNIKCKKCGTDHNIEVEDLFDFFY